MNTLCWHFVTSGATRPLPLPVFGRDFAECVCVDFDVFYSVPLVCLAMEPSDTSQMDASCVYPCNDGSAVSLAFLCTKLINVVDTT